MTHHDDDFLAVPAHLHLVPGVDDAPAEVGEVKLLIMGQGTIAFTSATGEPFSVATRTSVLLGSAVLQWDVEPGKVSLRELTTTGEPKTLLVVEGSGAGVDPDPACPYWFSVDCHNRRLGYGKGEMRVGCRIASVDLVSERDGDASREAYRWLEAIDHLVVTPALVEPADVWRDPVTVEPAMRIVPRDRIGMVEMARGESTVIENLTPECEVLYANIAGDAFVLDAPDFPDFSKAIQASINDPDGWCYKRLVAKAHEFGEPAPLKTYLRITMGTNQGESPGIPFVMEIWPYRHYSPIHNHGAADAMIRVLHGEIHVSLYRMLSKHHATPFAEASFAEGDVTWITPRLNQVHMLRNDHYEACITIQCYVYALSDTTHHPYFDYIGDHKIEEFEPDSDADFLEFRERMRREWILGPDRPVKKT